MREHGQGYYTIGSAGHESNAYVAAALRPTDPALLHYRSGAFFLARTMQAGRSLDEGLRAVLLGMLASTDDPASGGRHKVFGDASLAIQLRRTCPARWAWPCLSAGPSDSASRPTGRQTP
jgi:2-oxoisovalerate dehydrogenase E1 component